MGISKKTIVAALPPFRNQRQVIKQRQGTKDIINEIGTIHNEYEPDYDLIYKYFDTGDIYSTSQGIWNFLKYNLTYNAESGSDQTVKSPSAILHPGEKIDCKHYSLFTGGVLDAIRRNEGDNWQWFYRFASYDKNVKIPAHVFVVVNDGGNEIWIDPVLDSFNQKKQPTYIEDYQPMLSKISGIGDVAPAMATVDVNKDQAEQSFLVMVTMDLFALKTLLNSNTMILYGPVKNYFKQKGFDFNKLLLILNS